MVSRLDLPKGQTKGQPRDALPGEPAGPPPVDGDRAAVWLRLVAAGDPDAFRALYDATSPRLFALAMMMLRRRDLAEDAVQEAYVNVRSKAAQYDPRRGPAMPWLARIVRNAALSRIRSQRAGHEDIDDHAGVLPAPPVDPGLGVDIARALARLSTPQREAVVLACVHGFSHQEVAERLGAPLGTVKAWISRGAERFRVQFGT